MTIATPGMTTFTSTHSTTTASGGIPMTLEMKIFSKFNYSKITYFKKTIFINCDLYFEHKKTIISKLIKKSAKITLGPHRGPRVTQQISVLHMEQHNQSQPVTLLRIIPHFGQFIAVPFCSMLYKNKKIRISITQRI